MPLRLIVWDFDRTLSVIHVFHLLSSGRGGGDSDNVQIPLPHALSEIGQLARVAELDRLPQFSSRGGFALTVFGGRERVEFIRQSMSLLKADGIECVLCTKGLVGPVQKILDQVGLLPFFSMVFGRMGETYGKNAYDAGISPVIVGPEMKYMGSRENCDWSNKVECVSRLLQQRRLEARDAIFVDDEPSEIEAMKQAKVCNTIQVKPACGISNREVDYLRQVIDNSREFDNKVQQQQQQQLFNPDVGGGSREEHRQGRTASDVSQGMYSLQSLQQPPIRTMRPQMTDEASSRGGFATSPRGGANTVRPIRDDHEGPSELDEETGMHCFEMGGIFGLEHAKVFSGPGHDNYNLRDGSARGQGYARQGSDPLLRGPKGRDGRKGWCCHQ